MLSRNSGLSREDFRCTPNFHSKVRALIEAFECLPLPADELFRFGKWHSIGSADRYDLGVYVVLVFPKVLGPEIGVVYENHFPIFAFCAQTLILVKLILAMIIYLLIITSHGEGVSS